MKSNISLSELTSKLRAMGGANRFACIVSVTDAKAKKTNNPFGTIYKMARVGINMGWIYKNAVNNQLAREEKEADFTPQPRKWGNRISGTCLVEHGGAFYLEAKPEHSFAHKYFYINDKDNKIVLLTKEQVKPFLPEKKKPATQSNLDKQVFCSDYAIASIRKINMNGEKYKINKGKISAPKSIKTKPSNNQSYQINGRELFKDGKAVIKIK